MVGMLNGRGEPSAPGTEPDARVIRMTLPGNSPVERTRSNLMDSSRVPGDGTSAIGSDPPASIEVPVTVPGYRLESASAGEGTSATGPDPTPRAELPVPGPVYRVELGSVEEGMPTIGPGAVAEADVPVTVPGYRFEPAPAVET